MEGETQVNTKFSGKVLRRLREAYVSNIDQSWIMNCGGTVKKIGFRITYLADSEQGHCIMSQRCGTQT